MRVAIFLQTIKNFFQGKGSNFDTLENIDDVSQYGRCWFVDIQEIFKNPEMAVAP